MLPLQYRWLNNVANPPKMLMEALKLHGTVEVPGAGDSPIIKGWAKEVGLERVYTADSIPWCGLFMAVVAKRAGKPIATNPLWALSWAKWGEAGGQPRLGDVLTFVRKGGGHVGLYIGEDASAYHVLGGNQSDQVCITRIAKIRLYRVRRFYAHGMPDSAKPMVLASYGDLSHNEA